MKYGYAYMTMFGILFLIPLLIRNYIISKIIFQIVLFTVLIIFGLLDDKTNKKDEIISFVFFIILTLIHAFDTEGEYFFLPNILLATFLLIVTITGWRKNDQPQSRKR